MGTVLVFDADNTLWDTDSVFRHAQLAALGLLESAGLGVNPDEQLATLRNVDRRLMEHFGVAEYDFSRLFYALAYHFARRSDLASAVDAALTPTKPDDKLQRIARQAVEEFTRELQRVPEFLPGVEQVMSQIGSNARMRGGVAVLIYSEGDTGRLERIMEAHRHHLRDWFDDVIIGPKTVAGFKRAKELGLSILRHSRVDCDNQFLVVGDSLHRDIKLGNQSGFVTVYKPSPYKGHEKPGSPWERPAFSIQSFLELVPILTDFGIRMTATNNQVPDTA